MIWQVEVRPDAERDLDQALDWYVQEAPHQVPRFALAVDAAIRRISSHPLVPAPFHRDLRRIRLRAFPYHVWYWSDSERRTIHVVALLHDHRDEQPFLQRK